MSTETVSITDIPKNVFEQAGKEIENHLTALILENEFIGTGTFIQWKDKFGILTAEHVTNNPESSRLTCRFNANSRQILQLVVASRPHRLAFEMRHLQNITLGERASVEFGPDISVIVLPQSPQLGTIKSIKSFWRLDTYQEEKLDEALNEGNFVVVAGCPAERQTNSEKAVQISGIAAVPSVKNKYFSNGNFDYVDTTLGLGKATGSDAVFSYRGVSGGSLWRVKIGKVLNKSGIITRPYLAGVNFMQGKEIEGVRDLRSHGPKTIYNSLLPKLLGS